MPILDRSLSGAGEPREIEPGTFGVTDLLRHSAETIASWHLGLSAPEGIPPWLAKRGKAIERGLLEVVPPGQKHLVLRLELGNGCTIQGHPDYLWDPDGVWEIGEAKSGLSEDEDRTEAQALDQALCYVALHDAGARVAHERGLDPRLPEPGGIEVVNVLQGGLWDAGETHFRIDRTATGAVLRHLEAKAGVLAESLDEQTLAPALEWDERHQPLTAAPRVTPVAEEELGQLADETVQLYRDHRALKKMYDELRARWLETLDLATCRRVRAPSGGLIGLVEQTKVDEAAFRRDAADLLQERTVLQGRIARARKRLEAQLREQHGPEIERLQEIEERLAQLRQAHERATKGYVRVYDN